MISTSFITKMMTVEKIQQSLDENQGMVDGWKDAKVIISRSDNKETALLLLNAMSPKEGTFYYQKGYVQSIQAALWQVQKGWVTE